MTLQEIKEAVRAGKTVHWGNAGYIVTVDKNDQWLIKCISNQHCIGLTWTDEVTMNGKPEEFFIALSAKAEDAIRLARKMVEAMQELNSFWQDLDGEESGELNELFTPDFPFRECFGDTCHLAQTWIDNLENTKL